MKPRVFICIKSGHSVILQLKQRPEIATEAPTEEQAMALMRTINPDEIDEFYPVRAATRISTPRDGASLLPGAPEVIL